VFERYPFDQQYSDLEDLDFLFRLVSDVDIELYNVQEVLYFYRQHQDSIIHRKREYRDNQYRLRFDKFLTDLNIPINDQQKQCYIDFCYGKKMSSDSLAILEVAIETIIRVTSNKFPTFEDEVSRRLAMATKVKQGNYSG
jgi:predicted Ser/Thr protein kinase